MLRSMLILWTFVFAISAQANDSVLWCYFENYRGIEAIGVERTPTGLRVDIYMLEDEPETSRYSLPMAGDGRLLKEVRLTGFKLFEDLKNPRIIRETGAWFLKAKGLKNPLECIRFHDPY
jgi:hypothetical protein